MSTLTDAIMQLLQSVGKLRVTGGLFKALTDVAQGTEIN